MFLPRTNCKEERIEFLLSGEERINVNEREWRVDDPWLAAGCDVDAETGTGATPMMVAVAGGWEPCVALLLEAGAQVNSPSTWLDGRSARILAEERAKAEELGGGGGGGGAGTTNSGMGGTGTGTGGTVGVYGRILALLEGAEKPRTVRGAIMGARKPACHQPDFPVGRATPGARAADATVPPQPPQWANTVSAFSGMDTRTVRFT